MGSSGSSSRGNQQDEALTSPAGDSLSVGGEAHHREHVVSEGGDNREVDRGAAVIDVAKAAGASMDGEGGQRAEQLQETCIECEDQHAELVCLSCDEPFCRPCWGSLHR